MMETTVGADFRISETRIEEWRVDRLENLCVLIADCPHSTPTWTDSGVFVIRSWNVRKGVLNFDKTSFTDEKTYLERIRKAKPTVGDIVITREAPMGEVAMIPDNLKCCLGQRLVLLRPDDRKINKKFLLYSLQSKGVQNQILSNEGTGSTVSNLRIPDLKALKIRFPSREEQQRIADTLSSIDDKIELNRQTAQTLEDIAQAIFKEWFVDFNFPGATGEIQESDLGAIPKGWRIMSLRELGLIVTGKTPSSSTPDHFGDYMPFITPTDFKNYGKLIVDADRRISKKGASALKNKILPVNSIIVTCIGSDMGKVAINRVESLTNQQINSIVPNENVTSDFLYHSLLEKYELLRSIASGGSTMPIINKGQFEKIKILVAPVDLLKTYQATIDSLNELIEKTIYENQSLKELRDILLPKLMKGEIIFN